ncbi:MAG: arsenate reductase (glutaredoxin) [Asticcacaulis sp.]|uniref:arsenate reductase (glutaredoxin) n=1 Tax=Asticcacaulis sp. TaxID=1872648 RepID=UPI003F7CC817
MSDYVIYHNPNCSTSRKALEALRAAGHEPQVVNYLKTGWTEAQLQTLFAAMGKTPRDLLRVRGTPAEALGLTQPGVSDAAILEAMTQHPALVERPIVVTPKGTILARPLDNLNAVI